MKSKVKSKKAKVKTGYFQSCSEFQTRVVTWSRVERQTRVATQSRIARRTCVAFAIFLLTFAFLLLPSLSAPRAESVRLAVFDDAWQTIRDRYYDPNFHGVDWEAERAHFRPLAAEARSNAELYALLRRMITDLHDAHTRVYPPDEKFDWQHPRYISVGLSVREVGGQASSLRSRVILKPSARGFTRAI